MSGTHSSIESAAGVTGILSADECDIMALSLMSGCEWFGLSDHKCTAVKCTESEARRIQEC